MTYSIVARDPGSGRFGVAIQTCWPFVGAECPWVESGVGAVATQSFARIAHGPDGLALLRSRVGATDAIARLLDADPGQAVRQVGIVDASGAAAAWTGESCVEAAGHVTADGVSIQANMMERPTVWPAMLEAWEAPAVSFVDRLLAALRAAEREGGDLRGRQSAALIVSGTPDEPAWTRRYDIRVDDHPVPLDELERLVRLHLGFDALDRAEELGRTGRLEEAEHASDEASRLAPGDSQVVVWRAIGASSAGFQDVGRKLIAEATAVNPRWPEFIRRFVASGAQPDQAEGALRLIED